MSYAAADETRSDALPPPAPRNLMAFAGPVIAVGLAFSSRRWMTFVLTQFLGPAGFGALVLWGG